MPNSRIPTPAEALEAVSPITPEVYRAFEHGITKASLYFKGEGITPHDPWAYSMLVKLHAREHLRRCPNFASVIFDKMSLCGISFHYNSWQFRLWRSADHQNPKLPHPGRSNAKKSYYVQMELFGDTSNEPAGLRLVILWDVNRAGTLETLWLVCPRNFNRKTGEITVHWDLELPNPIFGVASPSQAAPTEDLPYRRKKQKDAKGG